MDAERTEKDHILRERVSLETARAARRQAEYGSDKYWELLRNVLEKSAALSKQAWNLRERLLNLHGYHWGYQHNYIQRDSALVYHKERLAARIQIVCMRQLMYRVRQKEMPPPLKPHIGPSQQRCFIQRVIDTKGKPKCPLPSFVRDVRVAYGKAVVMRRSTSWCWCIIRDRQVPPTDLRAVEIFPHSLGQQWMTYIFGPEARGKLYTVANGLLLPPNLAKQFNQYQVTLVPTNHRWNDHSDPWTWKLLIVDRKGLWNKPMDCGMCYGELHNRSIPFHDTVRPNGKFLFFHYLCAMLLQARRDKEDGARLDEAGLEDAWMDEGRVHTGPYIRDTVLGGFVEQFNESGVSQTFRTKVMAHSRPTDETEEEEEEAVADIDPQAEMAEDSEAEEEAAERLDEMIEMIWEEEP
ncbi:hypothetical protein TESG_06447 [Trichophyton tonsurans CBS 112818]|uniref:HNH nuclease domain-containing protein n=1 Tax=Trichophyton tonsurans (strain CBS 112818) TaxID=647933 RepID=F2S6A8_TRIT1|nr:hypothetical protein TESG_06447 [Trichophyton tonsurans CBS 112818]